MLEMSACTSAASVSLFMVRWLILACRDHDYRATHAGPAHAGSLLVSLQALAPSLERAPRARACGPLRTLLGGTTPPGVRAGGHER